MAPQTLSDRDRPRLGWDESQERSAGVSIKNGCFFFEGNSQAKMDDDLGVPLFQETAVYLVGALEYMFPKINWNW